MSALALLSRGLTRSQDPAPPATPATPPAPPAPPAPPTTADAPFPEGAPDISGDQPPTFVIPDSIGDAMETGMQVLFGIVLLLVVVWPLVRLFVRRMERRMTTYVLPPALDSRLTRIEQGVEAIAIEIERVSEAQRFSTKLMAERESVAPARAAAAARLPDPDR